MSCRPLAVIHVEFCGCACCIASVWCSLPAFWSASASLPPSRVWALRFWPSKCMGVSGPARNGASKVCNACALGQPLLLQPQPCFSPSNQGLCPRSCARAHRRRSARRGSWARRPTSTTSTSRPATSWPAWTTPTSTRRARRPRQFKSLTARHRAPVRCTRVPAMHCCLALSVCFLSTVGHLSACARLALIVIKTLN